MSPVAGVYDKHRGEPCETMAEASHADPDLGNLPISVALVWITNPVTISPMYYFLVPGRFLDPQCAGATPEHGIWLEWRNWLKILAPLTIGGLVCGTICAVLGYFAVQVIWRWNLARRLRRRRVRYCSTTSGFSTPSSKRQT